VRKTTNHEVHSLLLRFLLYRGRAIALHISECPEVVIKNKLSLCGGPVK